MNDDLIDIPDMRPFPKFCYTIGMIPTSFRVSMTYEEQVMEIIRFIKEEIIPNVNANALATKELQEKFVELVDYVNDYFENIDVQTEINAKLEQMVATGEFNPLLENLFRGYQEQIDLLQDNITDNYNVLNDKININYNTLLSQITGGSPAGTYADLATLQASATADTSKIYITLDDGKWCYYDTTNEEWTAGGDYLANDYVSGITPNQLSFIEQKTLNIFDNTATLVHGAMDNYGAIITSGDYYLTGLLPVKAGVTYYKKNNFSGAFYDENQDLLEAFAYDTSSVTAPAGARYIQSWFANADLNKYYISTVNRYTPYGFNPFYIKDSNLKNLIQSLGNLKTRVKVTDTDFFTGNDTNLFTTKNIATGYALSSDGTLSANEGFSTTDYLILPEPTGTIVTTACYVVVEYDSSYNVVAYHSGLNTAKTFSLAENATYIRATFANTALSTSIILLNETIADYQAKTINALQFRTTAQLESIINQMSNNATFVANVQAIAQNLPLTQLNWCAMGDSWTEENNTATNNYVKLVENALNLDVTNLGVSGTGFKRGEANSNAYYQKTSSIPLDTDVLTIMASGNDLSQGYTIGTATDTGTSTICGCINTLLDNIYTRFTGIRVGIISVGPWQNNTPEDTTSFTTYVSKIKEICNLRGVPFLDIFHQSNLRPNDSTFRTNFMPDGVHPNNNGYKLFANRIIEFIKSL